MTMYRPTESAEMTTPMTLQTPTQSSYNGVRTNTFTDASGTVFCNFKTYGGTERQVNGIIEVEETAQITCWFRPDITSGCRLKRLADGAVFEIIGDPEDIELRHQFLKFKIRRIKGGA
ncbi:MAG: phage head closure protein [Ruminococcus sp.]|nr:phage head closure protein [Ruminococcus sp.]